MAKTIDEKAYYYSKNTNLEPRTYAGDVETAYTCGYLQCESDMIRKLWDTEQFTMSKIAEMLGKTLMEVRNAVNYNQWQ